MPHSSALHRYWFTIPGHIGIGVTAPSRKDAETIARDTARRLRWPFDESACIEDVDVRELDQRHVIPNMGPPHTAGIWYPRSNP